MDSSRRASLLLALSLVSCNKPRTAEGAAREFIDRYYIERDHAKALEVTEGGAAERVRAEKKLLEESNATSYGVSPRVFYNLQGQKPNGDRTDLTYQLTVDSSGVQLKKEVRISVSNLGSGYKVTFFHERDLPAK